MSDLSSHCRRGAPTPHPSLLRNHWSFVIRHSSFPLAVAASLLLALATTACGPSAATEARELAPDYRPVVLRIGWVPNEEDVERRTRWDGLTSFLSRKLDMPVELVQTASYSPAIEALRARKLEVVGLNPFGYVIASSRGVALPLVVPGTAAGAPRIYRSGLIVPRDSPIRTIDDIVARAGTLTLSWSDPASTSGHLVPRAYLESLGLNPERDFKQTVFSMSHTASVLTVKAGKVDVAAVTTSGLSNLIETGRVAADDVRVIWESQPIFPSLIAIRADLPPAFRDEVQAAYLAFADEDPTAWEKFAVIYRTEGVRWVPAHDKDFDELRRLARSVEHLDLLGE